MRLTPIRIRTFYWVSQLGMLAGTGVYVNAGTRLAQIDSQLHCHQSEGEGDAGRDWREEAVPPAQARLTINDGNNPGNNPIGGPFHRQ
jgi:hypothetical protein